MWTDLAMNKQDYLDPKQKYEFSEWRHTVSILNAENVTVKDLTLLSSGGDGVYPNSQKGLGFIGGVCGGGRVRCSDGGFLGFSPRNILKL